MNQEPVTSSKASQRPKKCPIPHVIVLVGEGGGPTSAKQHLAHYPHPVLLAAHPEDVKGVVVRLTEVDKKATPRRRFLLCMLGMQPGSGKSSYSVHAHKVLND